MDPLLSAVPVVILLGALKVFVIIGFGLYAVFAFIAFRQISLMTRTIETPLSPTLRLMGIVHFLASLGLIVLALFFL